jgi:hypothetical protein
LGSTRISTTAWATSLFGVCILSAAGCLEEKVGADEAAETTTGDGDGDTGTDTDTDTSAPWEPIPARGDIALSHVIVNQGVDVPIAVEGVWVGPEARNTYVVANRDTLLRGFWEIPDDWVAREITARLLLEYPDGTDETIQANWMIDGPSFPGDFDRAFVFPLLAEQFPPGIKYHLSLWEAGPGYEDQRESTTVIESPIGGTEQIGVQPEPAELKIVMIPVAYDIPGCVANTGSLESISEAQEQLFIDYLHEQYPVTNIVWEFRRDQPIQWNSTLNSLTQLHFPLQELRTSDGAAPNVYYYAVVDACVGGIDGAGGVAAGIPPDTKAAAYDRVASGMWLDGAAYAYETFVHEIGHLHGRSHIYCAGGEAAGVDPSYPYENGITSVWGFGIRLFKFHSPTASYDFMTYCSPTWVSDWGWTKAYDRVRTLTAWDYEGKAQDDEEPGEDLGGEVLIGLLFNDGTEQWSTTPGAREASYFSSGEVVSFDYGDGIVEAPTNIQILDDGTKKITAMVPRPGVAFVGASRIDAGEQAQARPIVLVTPETRTWSF